MYKNGVKRIIDFCAAFFGLLMISPLLLLLIILLYFTNKGSVFFTQSRPGKNGKIFKVIKFKTMTDERDKDGNLLPDDQRLTKIGQLVRSTSLDELPQLLNVLKGDMSLIGPRPLLPQYLPLYSKEQQRRHEVRPGITGWAQVNGRNAISWEQKFEYDVWYVDHVSFLLDSKILWMTMMKVIARKDIGSNTTKTMEVFHGNPTVCLYGAGGHGKVVLDIMERLCLAPDWIEDDNAKNGELWMGYETRRNSSRFDQAILGIGSAENRKKVSEKIIVDKYLTLIDPSAIVSSGSCINEGTVVMQGAIVQTCTEIGKHCIINTGASIDHDCKLDDFVHISPQSVLCGNVEIGEGTWIGAGAVVKQGVKIGKGCVIGAGSVVLKDIPDNSIAYGNPCKISIKS